MHVAKYFPEAYEGRLPQNGGEFSIVEVATGMEIGPILFRRGVWALTPLGIECLKMVYQITKDRFDESDWYDHMEEKGWVNMEDFSSVLNAGRDFVRLGII